MRSIFIIVLLLNFIISFAQSRGDKEGIEYDAAKVVDSEYGITIYDKMNPHLGGDSARDGRKGYAMQGYAQDYYTSGKLLHKGYYEDGQLKNYKNYYENGQIERAFKVIDFKKASMELYYPTGAVKSKMVYYNFNLLKVIDYYENGQIAFETENVRNMGYLMFRHSYYKNGQIEEGFDLVNKKKLVFSEKMYHENGEVKVEGKLRFNPYKFDYMKNGVWKYYDKDGGLRETYSYVNGERIAK